VVGAAVIQVTLCLYVCVCEWVCVCLRLYACVYLCNPKFTSFTHSIRRSMNQTPTPVSSLYHFYRPFRSVFSAFDFNSAVRCVCVPCPSVCVFGVLQASVSRLNSLLLLFGHPLVWNTRSTLKLEKAFGPALNFWPLTSSVAKSNWEKCTTFSENIFIKIY